MNERQTPLDDLKDAAELYRRRKGYESWEDVVADLSSRLGIVVDFPSKE